MCMLDMIVNIANQKVHRPVIILACSDQHSCFVTAKDNGNKCCTLSLCVL